MNVNTPTKIILTIIIIGLIGTLFYFTTYQKQIKEIGTLKEDLKTKQTKLAEIKEKINDLPNLVAQKEKLEAMVKKALEEGLVAEKTEDFVPNYLTQIEELTKEIRLKTGDLSFVLVEIRPGAVGVEQTQAPGAAPGEPPAEETGAGEEVFAGFPTRTFEMSMKGRYNTLIEFLTQLSDLKLKRLVEINRIGLSPEGQDKIGGSPILNITIPIKAYLRQGG
ncbi:MAG: hypothetical protein ABIH00_06825 [Armatimonadota bacterium]